MIVAPRLRIAIAIARGHTLSTEIRDFTGMNKDTVEPHLRRMAEGGVVTRTKDKSAMNGGRPPSRYELTDYGKRMLLDLKRSLSGVR